MKKSSLLQGPRKCFSNKKRSSACPVRPAGWEQQWEVGCWWRGGGASFEKLASELRLKCGEGAGCVGERVKTKKVAPVTRIGTGTACANHGQRLSGSMSAEMRRYRKTLLKTTAPPNSEPGGRRLLCGLLWGLFRSQFYVRCWRHYSPLRHLSRSQDFPFTCPSRAPARPPCPHTVRTLLLRHYNLVYQRSQFHSPLHDLSPGLTVTPV